MYETHTLILTLKAVFQSLLGSAQIIPAGKLSPTAAIPWSASMTA
jgi:hypothetical protein